MVTTTEIVPTPAITPFVRCYSLRSFDTGGMDVIKPWYAAHELYMPFFFGAKPIQLFNHLSSKIIYGYCSGAVGLSTRYIGDMTFNGNYSFFSIHFRPGGFSKIFGLPLQEFTNNIVGADDFLDASVKVFYEQLQHVHEQQNLNRLNQMAVLADAFLTSYLKKRKSIDNKDNVACISGFILKNAGRMSVHQLSHIANMSTRNFERCFNEQVGTSPKLFCRIIRFNHALNLKLKNPLKDWTSVALETGYFDQMHFIKDFKEFTGSSPSVFLKQTPLLERDFANRVDI